VFPAGELSVAIVDLTGDSGVVMTLVAACQVSCRVRAFTELAN
jgi:hypothetical protein